MSGAQSLGAGMRICGCRDDVITLEGELILLIWLHRLLSIMHSIRVCVSGGAGWYHAQKIINLKQTCACSERLLH
jgi:hypothetical protein